MVMETRYPDAEEVAEKMKEGARAAPWVPLGTAPKERYHHFPDGLSICLTVDIISSDLVEAILGMSKLARIRPGKFWHLSIARLGEVKLTEEEVFFWRETFFTDKPDVELPGWLTGINSHHFFWRIPVLDNPSKTPR